MSVSRSALLLLCLVGIADSGMPQSPAEEKLDPDWRLKAERRTLELLASVDALECDFVLNGAGGQNSMRAIPGRTTILTFWRPTCEPCKPLLKKLGAFSERAPHDTVVLSAVEVALARSSDLDLLSARRQVTTILQQQRVAFPVCAYTDHAQTKRWQAEGVPLTLFFDTTSRVRRVALGSAEASAALEQLRAGWRP